MTRVWDKFLTERDKEHFAASGRGDRGPKGFGSRPAIIVVDDYYSSVGHVREPLLESIKTWPGSCGLEGWEAIDRTAELLAVARPLGVPIAYVHSMEHFPFHWGGRRRQSGGSSAIPENLRAMANEIVAEVAPQPGDLVLQKNGPSAFHRTPLQDYLVALGIDTVLVVGESTSGCVRATVVDGTSLRYKVGVIEECVFDRTEACHAINLLDMHLKYADVIDLEAAGTYMRQVSAPETLSPVIPEMQTT